MSKKTFGSGSYSWEEYFAQHILSRGWEYYREGAVTNLTEEDDGEFTATVQGTDDYCVEIDIEDGIPVCMECDCPYADGGYNCKHMAAVLYAIEERDTTDRESLMNEEQDFQDGLSSVEQLIDRIPEAELKSVLIQLCYDNETAYRWLDLRYPAPVSGVYLRKLHGEMEQICTAFSDRSGFIDWKNAGDFELAVTGFLHDNTKKLLASGETMLAFQFVNDTLRRVSEQDIDDDGQLNYIAYVGADCWEKITAAGSSTEKEEIFRWFLEHLDEKDLPDYLDET